jgi:hypothetical protein
MARVDHATLNAFLPNGSGPLYCARRKRALKKFINLKPPIAMLPRSKLLEFKGLIH